MCMLRNELMYVTRPRLARSKASPHMWMSSASALDVQPARRSAPPEEHHHPDAAAGAHSGLVEEYTLVASMWDFVTLRTATKFVNTKDGAMQSMENFGLMSALLLTMVSVSEAQVLGDKLSFMVGEQAAEAVYVTMSFVAMSGFFLATIAAATILIFCSFLRSDAELLAYVSQCGYLWKMALGTFLIGFFSFILSQFWLCASLLGVTAMASLSVPTVPAIFVVLYGFAHSGQVLHTIKTNGLMTADAAALES